MRKKIGKRIGPVPITLAAVLALAAALSVGLLLTLNVNLTHAQGLPEGATPNPAPPATKCEVVVDGEPDNNEQQVFGGGCSVSGDSADVVLKNTSMGDKTVVVYVTGGDDFPGLQATDVNAMDEVKSLGADGIDEHILTVKGSTTGAGNVAVPGTETITVSRDMAKSGEVYLFVYLTENENAKDFPDAAIGIPISLLAKDADTLNEKQTEALGTAGTDPDEMVDLVNVAVTAANADPPAVGENDPAELFPTAAPLPSINDGVEPPQTVDDAEANFDKAVLKIQEIKDAADYGNMARTVLHAAVRKADVAIMRVQSAIDAIEGADPSYFLNDDANISVKVSFREAAVEAKKSGAMYVPFENNKKLGSTIYVGRAVSGMGTVDEDGDIRTGAEDASVTVMIRDRYGVTLSGFVDFSIDTSADGAAGVVFDASSRSTHYVEVGAGGMADGTATVKITDLPETDPLKIPVTASFNNGELELTGNIIRKGDAMMVEATAYVCEADDDDKTNDDDIVTNDIICVSEIAALGTPKTSDDPDEVVALGPEDTFFIYAKATDAVGNKVGGGPELSWKLTASADNIDDAEKALPADGDTNETIVVASGSDAIPGGYSITVTSPDGEASTMIMVTVSDVASMIEISCDPMMIPTTSGLTECSIMVTDLHGNVPSNLHEDEKDDGSGRDMARVAVRSTDVILIGTDDNDVELDDEGMAMFSILLREDAPEGSSITVNVSSTIGSMALQDSVVVVYGDPQSEPGMPMNVMAEATSHDMITVSWESPAADGGSDITGYMVQRGYMDADNMMMWMDVDPAHMGMDKMYMDMGLMAETTYYYRVTAMNAVGSGEATDGMAMAMTMMMPSVELGDPSITNVMSDADGMATVMLMPGDNATKHYVWAYPMGGPQGMYSDEATGDATMVTFSGLTSGMNYWFIAVAGRGTDADSEWSDWSGWTAATPIQ